MSTTITLPSGNYNLITLPSYPGLSSLDLSMEDSVAVVQSPFVPSQIQTVAWPGADSWSLTFTLPKMIRAVAAPWKAFAAELRGMQNVFQIGDPWGVTPLGVASGAPITNTTWSGSPPVENVNHIFSTVLYTSGWVPNTVGQLLAGDYIQIGYRLYVAVERVDSDATGLATINIWPSLREVPPDLTPLTLTNTVGLFRLAANARSWHGDFNGLFQMSIKAVEVR